MTDTTDVKALRNRAASEVIANKGLISAELALILINQLEAERQRADYGRQVIDQRNAECDRLINEIAALKGDQVPFAFSYNYAGCETCEGFQDWRKELSRERPPEWMLETGKVTDLVELFTAPQKPVVLPEYKFCPAEYQGSLLWSETEVWNKAIDAAKAAIEASGGIVKDGE